jgi:hypothetical protein
MPLFSMAHIAIGHNSVATLMFLIVLLTWHKIVFDNRQNKIVQIDVDRQSILDIYF